MSIKLEKIYNFRDPLNSKKNINFESNSISSSRNSIDSIQTLEFDIRKDNFDDPMFLSWIQSETCFDLASISPELCNDVYPGSLFIGTSTGNCEGQSKPVCLIFNDFTSSNKTLTKLCPTFDTNDINTFVFPTSQKIKEYTTTEDKTRFEKIVVECEYLESQINNSITKENIGSFFEPSESNKPVFDTLNIPQQNLKASLSKTYPSHNYCLYPKKMVLLLSILLFVLLIVVCWIAK